MTVVCGTDFSSLGGAAAHVAARLAAKRGDKLVLVCAHAPELEGDEGARVVQSSLEREREALRALGAQVETRAIADDPAHALAELAKQEGARLVVVGAAERAGRVPDRTAAQSGAPVLVVRNKAPLDAWLDGKRTLRALLAVAPDHSHDAARALVCALRESGPVDVVAAQVSFPPEDRKRLGVTAAGGSAMSHDPVTEAALRAELEKNVGALPGAGDLKFVLKPTLEHVDDALLDLAASEAIDVIVVGARHRTGLSRWWYGSVAQGVVRHAKCNVVVAPAHAGQVQLPTVSTVLVPVDGTPACARSVALACVLAGARGTVHLVQVVERDDGKGEERLAAMRALVSADARALGTRVEAHVVTGKDAAEALCATAARLRADLVCMRTARSRSAATPLLLGSVTNEVLARATVPVVTVRDAA